MDAAPELALVQAQVTQLQFRPDLPLFAFNHVINKIATETDPFYLIGFGSMICEWDLLRMEHEYRVLHSIPHAPLDPYVVWIHRKVAEDADSVIYVDPTNGEPFGRIYFGNEDGYHSWGRSHHMRMYESDFGRYIQSLGPIVLPKYQAPDPIPLFPS